MNYYNENDPLAAAWIAELVHEGLIPDGVVDNRSIEEVMPNDVREFTQAHFFCGIAGWPLALQLAGWPTARPIWTGSAPCQPFSAAGNQKGTDDDRHLWPEFARLIRECSPPAILGEQVASKAGLSWLDSVQGDLEAHSYACAAATFAAGSVGAPHQRQRLYWMAHATEPRLQGHRRHVEVPDTQGRQEQDRPDTGGAVRGVANADGGRQPGQGGLGSPSDTAPVEAGEVNRAIYGGWSDRTSVTCRDGKARFVPALQPVVDGVPRELVPGGSSRSPLAHRQDPEQEARTMRLKGYGNAIVPQQAGVFIEAVMEVAPAWEEPAGDR